MAAGAAGPAARFPSSYEMRPPSRRPPCHLRGSGDGAEPGYRRAGTYQQRAFFGDLTLNCPTSGWCVIQQQS